MKTSELDYQFDPSLIATTPAQPRDDARLMVVERSNGSITHHRVRDLPQFLRSGDMLMLNRTSVLRARVHLHELRRDRSTEGLFLEPVAAASPYFDSRGVVWRMLLREAKRYAPNDRFFLLDHTGRRTDDSLVLLARDDDAFIVRMEAGSAGGDVATVLERSGLTPLPPYILRARKQATLTVNDDIDRREYQTIYADSAARGSVAAPTAGLHFTEELLATLAAQGVASSDIILDVGAGTFKPIDVDDLADHAMHSERFCVPAHTLHMLAEVAASRARRESRLIAVGTTSVRACESIPNDRLNQRDALIAHTRILISPGHQFRFTDGLLTNFHLPRSTLLALVGAFMGMELMHEAYAIAVRERYRFYSFGDAMLIV